MLHGLFLRTPNGAKKHDRLVIVLQVAALVAVNVYDFRHVSSPEMVVFQFVASFLSVICQRFFLCGSPEDVNHPFTIRPGNEPIEKKSPERKEVCYRISHITGSSHFDQSPAG